MSLVAQIRAFSADTSNFIHFFYSTRFNLEISRILGAFSIIPRISSQFGPFPSFLYFDCHLTVTKNGRHITDWRATLRYWADTEKKHASPASQLKPIPKSPSADVYRSLIYNLDE